MKNGQNTGETIRNVFQQSLILALAQEIFLLSVQFIYFFLLPFYFCYCICYFVVVFGWLLLQRNVYFSLLFPILIFSFYFRVLYSSNASFAQIRRFALIPISSVLLILSLSLSVYLFFCSFIFLFHYSIYIHRNCFRFMVLMLQWRLLLLLLQQLLIIILCMFFFFKATLLYSLNSFVCVCVYVCVCVFCFSLSQLHLHGFSNSTMATFCICVHIFFCMPVSPLLLHCLVYVQSFLSSVIFKLSHVWSLSIAHYGKYLN